MKYALIKENTVVNVIIADSAFIEAIQQEYDHIEAIDTELEQSLGVGVGWGWDGGFLEPEQPPAQAPAPPKRFITKRAFWNRFPALKESVMRAVRMSTPAGAAMLAGVLDRLNSRVDASPYVNLDDAQTIEGIQWLASVQCPASVTLDGVSYDMRLTEQERDAVLLAEIQESETYP